MSAILLSTDETVGYRRMVVYSFSSNIVIGLFSLSLPAKLFKPVLLEMSRAFNTLYYRFNALKHIIVKPGYWRASKHTSQVYKCNFERNCGGARKSSQKEDALITDPVMIGEYCAEGYRGVLVFRTELLVCAYNKNASDIAQEILQTNPKLIKVTELSLIPFQREGPDYFGEVNRQSSIVVDTFEHFDDEEMQNNDEALNVSLQFSLSVKCDRRRSVQSKSSENKRSTLTKSSIRASNSSLHASNLLISNWDQNETELPYFRVFLLYLNKNTFSKGNMKKLRPILRKIIQEDIPIIVLHEQDVKKAGEPSFYYFLKNTPQEFCWKLYEDIAIPLYSRKEYRQVSISSIVQKLNEVHDKKFRRENK